MRILVTGAGGFAGGHVVEFLRSRGDDVLGTSSQTMDVTNQNEVLKVVRDWRPEGIVHLAAQASVPRSWQDPESTFRVNVIGASHLLEAVRDEPSTRVVLIGSAQQYAPRDGVGAFKETDPLQARSPYAISKIAQEMLGRLYFEEFNLQVVMTRSFNHVGPGQSAEYAVASFASQITRGNRKIEVGNLDAVRDFLDVRDVATAYGLLLDKGAAGDVYNVCSGTGHRIGDLLEKMMAMAGIESQADIIEDVSGRRGDPDVLVGDNSKLGSLGWSPEIGIDRSLQDVLDWFGRDEHG